MGRSSGSSARMVWESCVCPSQAMCFFLLCDIYSMTSFDVQVIKINTITKDSVPAYKKNHTGVDAKITRESLYVLSHFMFKYLDLFSNFNSENIKNVLGDHGMSLGITCAWLYDHRPYKFCFLCATDRFALGYLTIVHHLLQRLLYILYHKRCK